MLSNLVFLLPVIFVVLGGMVALAAEPFLRDENKHKVLPWVAAFFIALSVAALYYAKTEALLNLYAMDPVRRVLCAAILLCGFLGISGLQWTLGREQFKGGEAYGLMMLATSGAMLMTQAIDFVALFIAMELTSFPIYALVGIRRKDVNANEGVFKYFVSGAVFSAIFLYGVSLIYGATGSTHFCGHVLEGLEEDGTVYPSYIYRQYDNQGNYSLELVTDATLEISGSASDSRIKVYFTTDSGSYSCSYEGPVEMIDNRQADVPEDVEMKDVTRVVAMDCGQVWDGIETTDYRDWILYFYDRDAESTNEYTCVEFLTKENVKGSLPDMKLSKVVQVGNPKDFVPGVIIGGYTDDDSIAWGTWYCKGGTAHYAATKGSIDIKNVDGGYSMTFDFVDEDETYGGTFKGSYTGPVEFKVDQAQSGAALRSAGKGFSPSRGTKAQRGAAAAGRHAVGQGRQAPAAPAARTPRPESTGQRARVNG